MADRIPAERGKSVLQISETPPEWRTPEEEQRLRAWGEDVEKFLVQCEAEDREFARTWWHAPVIVSAILAFLGWLMIRQGNPW
jgi:hypothetical protein